ncbi:MAG TPA: hypothetical protein VNV25_11445 [Gemmatimonadaceae bacterium]|nr:hypothetical protein [Gemmatimonadaceae bacterium]
MTGLRLVAQDTSLDSAGRVRKRDSVLRVYRLTPTVLESAASRLAERPDHAVELLHAIDARVAAAANKAAPPVLNRTTTPSAPAAPSVTRPPGAPGVRPPVVPPAKKPAI